MANLVQPLTPARALRRRHVRVPRQVLVGLLLVAVAVGGGLRWAYGVNSGREVVVAVREVPAGATISAADLATARVTVSDATYRAAVPASDLAAMIGQTAVERVHAGQIVVRAQLGTGSRCRSRWPTGPRRPRAAGRGADVAVRRGSADDPGDG